MLHTCTNLVKDMTFVGPPHNTGDGFLQGLSIAIAVGFIQQPVPPQIHPVWIQSQEQHQTIQI